MEVFCLHVFISTTYIPGAQRGKKRMEDPCGPGVIVRSLPVSAGNYMQFLCRVPFNHQAVSSVPMPSNFKVLSLSKDQV